MSTHQFGSIILSWYHKNKRDLPWRATRDPYLIWLSEIILQQTRVEQGLNYYLRFSENYPSVEKLASASEDEVLKLWQGLGYYSRGRNLLHTAKEITKNFNRKFPQNFHELRSLKGVGDYTASAIASFAFGKKEAVVDGNVFRLLSRYFGIKTPIDSSKAKKEFREIAFEMMENHSPRDFNQAIMEFGARQCRPANPDCRNCPLNNSCYAFIKDKVDEFPVKEKKQKIRRRYFHYLVIRDGKSFYVNKREGNDIWKNLYEFPCIESKRNTSESQFIFSDEWKNIFGKKKVLIEKIIKVKPHLLSHQSIHAKFYEIYIPTKLSFVPGKNWKKVNDKSVQKYAVPRLVEKFLETL